MDAINRSRRIDWQGDGWRETGFAHGTCCVVSGLRRWVRVGARNAHVFACSGGAERQTEAACNPGVPDERRARIVHLDRFQAACARNGPEKGLEPRFGPT